MAFSRMGNRLQTDDVTWATHERHYNLLEDEDHDMGLVENVPEYGEENVSQNVSNKWGVKSEVIDPRLFGQGVARSRRYAIAWRKDRLQWIQGMDLKEILQCLISTPVLPAADYFWKDLPEIKLPPSQDRAHQNIDSGSMKLGCYFPKQCVHTGGFFAVGQGAHSGVRYFSCKFPCKVSLVKC